MPLKPGKENISANISEMVRSDTFAKGKSKEKKREMAVAAALDKAREKRKSKVRRTLGKKKMKHPELRGRIKL